MSYESELDDDEPIEKIAKREFPDHEFKAGYKQGKFMFYGQTKKKDLKQHYKKAKEVFE